MEPNKDQLPGEVIQQVATEVKTLSTSVAGINEANRRLGASFEAVQSELKAVKGQLTGLDHEKLNKSIADLLTRQEAAEKNYNGQFEALSTAVNRATWAGENAENTELAQKQLDMHLQLVRSKELQRGQAVKNHDADFRKVYQKALETYLVKGPDFISQEERKALSEGIDSNGGYLLMPELSEQLRTKEFEYSPLRQHASVSQIGTLQWEEIVDVNRAGAAWATDTTANSTTSTPQLNKKTITAHILEARPLATQNLLDDAFVDVDSWLLSKLVLEFDITEGAAFISGDGVGKPRGLLDYASGTSWGQVERVNVGASGMTFEGAITLQNATKERYQRNAIWLLRRASMAPILKQVDGSGRYLFAGSILMEGPKMILLGKPVAYMDDMPDVAGAALSYIYGDLSQGYKIVDRAGLTVLRDPYSSKPSVEYFTRKRVGGDVVNFEAFKIGVCA